jgi:hypothetical protein
MGLLITFILLTILFPFGYGLLILWGAKYGFRSTIRAWLIAMGFKAVVCGFFGWVAW